MIRRFLPLVSLLTLATIIALCDGAPGVQFPLGLLLTVVPAPGAVV